MALIPKGVSQVQWPNDSDGDVFRRLLADGFDFSSSYTVDYNIDFDSWPPDPGAVAWLRETFGSVTIYEPEDGYEGYALIREQGLVEYSRVVEVQRLVSDAMAAFGGVCESWGVLH